MVDTEDIKKEAAPEEEAQETAQNRKKKRMRLRNRMINPKKRLRRSRKKIPTLAICG